MHALGGSAKVQYLDNGNEVAKVAQLNHHRFAKAASRKRVADNTAANKVGELKGYGEAGKQ